MPSCRELLVHVQCLIGTEFCLEDIRYRLSVSILHTNGGGGSIFFNHLSKAYSLLFSRALFKTILN